MPDQVLENQEKETAFQTAEGSERGSTQPALSAGEAVLTQGRRQDEVGGSALPLSSEDVQTAESSRENGEQPSSVPFSKYADALMAKDELLDMLLRRQAEYENLRRRTERDKNNFLEFALSDFIGDLLPVLDGLERGLNSPHGESIGNFKMGLCLLLKQFRDILGSAGLQTINTQGQFFDPNLHHAVLREENDQVPENQILEEFQCGYLFKKRLLRPSMVKVAVPISKEDSPSDPGNPPGATGEGTVTGENPR
jgi:molecular chaperone GrpE